VLREHAVNGGAADAMDFGDLAQALPAPAVAEDSFAVEFQGTATDVAPIETSAAHAGANPLDDQ